MQLKEIVGALEKFAPLPLQDSYDNSGLQIGLTTAEVSGALVCLDVTEKVLDEARKKDCNLVVAHHPLLFHGCKRITEEGYVPRCVIKAIENHIAVYAAHTSLDNAPGGVSYEMAQKLGLSNVKPLVPSALQTGAGSGVIGEFEKSISPTDFLQWIKQEFKADCVRHNDFRKPIQKVALCGGAGAFLIPDALRADADAFYTGEIKYHDFFGLEEKMLLVDTGHYESEQFTIGLLHRVLQEAFPTLRIEDTTIHTNPIKYL